MTNRSMFSVVFALLLAFAVSGCTLIEGVFKTGFWAGIIVVVLIVVALLFLFGKARE